MKFLYAVLFFAIVGFFAYAYFSVDNSSDDVQIATLFDDATQAANHKNVGGIMDKVSADYSDSEDLSKDRLRLLIVQVFRNSGEFSVTTEIAKMEVFEDEANVTILADIKTTNLGQDSIQKTVSFKLHKENGYHMGVIPVKVWRVVSSKGFDFSSHFGL
jgi:hypothetical protein